MPESYILKIHRAQEHLDVLNQIAEWWFQTHPYRVGENLDAKSGLKEIAVFADDQPPARLALVAGDVIQNLRSSLDHLVGEIARFASGGYLMPKVEQALQFPITTSKGKFRAERRRGRLGCVPPRVQAAIHRLQPYRSRDAMERHPLFVLQELSNIDKHRRLPLLLSVISSISYDKIHVVSPSHFEVLGGGLFVDKAVLVRMNPDAQVEMDLGAIGVEIAFGDGTPLPGAPLAQTLRDLMQWTAANVLGPLSSPV
jgi:hypothetical protein